MSILRIPNLLVVALTQVLLFYGIFLPAYEANDINPALDASNFFLLVLATCLVTAAGYVINDLEDVETDAINRPDRRSIGRTWSVDMARYLFLCLILFAYLCSLLLAFNREEHHLIWIFPFSVFGLSFYSLYLKKIAFWGNLVVALYCVGVAGLILLAERTKIHALFEISPASAQRLILICSMYMLFAFWSTLLREIVKDLEDREGDQKAGYRTLAVIWPESSTRFVSFLCVAALAISICLPVYLFQALITSVYFQSFVGILLLLLLWWTYYLYQAKGQKDYHRLSQWLKWYMIGGIFLILLF